MTKYDGLSHPGTVPALTLGIAPAWIEAHCVVPNDELQGQPFTPTLDHLVWLANWYRVRPEAKLGQKNTAFHYRTGVWVAAQKVGKSPAMAAEALFEFVGPSLFGGFAEKEQVYYCADHGCPCGWGSDAGDFEPYVYAPGEPMGRLWPSPRLQFAAVAEDQVENTWGALVPMINMGPLADMLKAGEEFINHPWGGRDARMEIVTSKANTRLGARITAGKCDEIGLWNDHNKMKKFWRTMARGAAGMGGRLSGVTNPPDPSEASQAQALLETPAKDVYKHHFPPPAELDFKKKRERIEIFRYNYQWSPWVDVKSIEAEAADVMRENPGEAERFFGNRIVVGSRAWIQPTIWEQRARPKLEISKRTKIVCGFDGSEVNDWTGIRAETLDFHQFTPRYFGGRRETIWDPAAWDGRVPRNEVHAAWEDIFREFDVVRVYCDPFKWETELAEWADRYGDRIFIEWRTNRISQMHSSLEHFKTDIVGADSKFTHDGCVTTSAHVRNAVEVARPGQKYILNKASESQKIDLAMSAVLAHEAATDAVAAGDRQMNDTTNYAWI